MVKDRKTNMVVRKKDDLYLVDCAVTGSRIQIITSSRVVVGQIICAGIFRLRYDILLLLCVYCDHNLLIPKISLKNIEFCVFYDH